jgi:hypothetical protein
VRRRILLLVVGMTTVVVLAFAIPLALLTHQVVAQRADSSVTEQARGIAAYVRTAHPTKSELTAYVRRQVADTGRPVSVQLPDGTQVGSVPVRNEDQPRRPGSPATRSWTTTEAARRHGVHKYDRRTSACPSSP